MKHLLLIVVVLGLGSACVAMERAEQERLLQEGDTLFRQANDRASTDVAGARELYGKAVRRFERIVNEGGIQNGKLFYNIGNTYFRMDDIGRAILNYRRAEPYRPHDANLRRNMQFARARRLDSFEEPQTRRVLKTLFFWHYDLSAPIRVRLFGICFMSVWLLATVRIFVPRGWIGWALGASALLALLLVVSLGLDVLESRRVQPGVILDADVVARKGDSRSYEPRFKDPLHAGTEFIRLESRSGWYRAALPDGSECWLPEGSVGMVR